ncbi:hypothetical protein L6452_19553 [Arctium lappa]|uniref:Uncharacterized protein n=1 Tax=Arctium lappa TaxID=4217 RepID=A0ACB9B9T6_ARCLA|nr:hypothetical protein L6452_19553 [Arctium lappa]
MEEQFILRVPPSVAQHIDRLLSESASSSDDKSLDLSFSGKDNAHGCQECSHLFQPLIPIRPVYNDGRSGTFVIGDDHFSASLLDLPCIVESYKTYDDGVLIKTADVGQVGNVSYAYKGDPTPDVVEHRNGLTPPMRDARRRRFRTEPDLNVQFSLIHDHFSLKFYLPFCLRFCLVIRPELVRRVEKDLLNIMNGGTAENVDILSFYLIFCTHSCQTSSRPASETAETFSCKHNV